MEQTQEHFLSEMAHLVQANRGKRFANYIIDLIIFYLLIFAGGMILAIVSPQTIENIPNSAGFGLLDRLLTLIVYGIYMGLTEGIFRGKSLGKLITGTRAVNEDGTNISFQTGFLRGLSRSVPFEAFSALGYPSYPWHDRWNRTYVIEEKASILPPQ